MAGPQVVVGARFDGNPLFSGVAKAKREFVLLGQEVTVTDAQLKKHVATLGGMASGVSAATKELQNLRKTSGTVNSSLLSLGRIVQDAPYGFEAVANNIAFTAEQMGFLVAQSDGLKNALRELKGALFGPIGLVLGLNALVTAFQFYQKAAKKAKEESRGLAESLEKFVELTDSVTSPEFFISEAQLPTAVDILTKKIAKFKEVVDRELGKGPLARAREEAESLGVNIDQLSAKTLSSLGDQIRGELDLQNELKGRLPVLQAILNKLETRQKILREERALLAELRRLNLARLKDGVDVPDKVIGVGLGATLEDTLLGQDLPGAIEKARNELIGPDGLVAGFVALQAVVPGLAGHIARLSRELDGELNASLKETIQLTRRLERQIESGLANAITGLTEGIFSGENIFSNIRNAVADLATDLGHVFIAAGVAKAVAIDKFLTSPPAAIIAAGVALVAAGAILRKDTAKAISNATGNAASQQTNTPTPRQFASSQESIFQSNVLAAPQAFGIGSQGRQLVATVKGRDLVFFIDSTRNDLSTVSV